MTNRDAAMLSVLFVVVLAIVVARFAAITGHLPCPHRCPWCLAKLQEASK